MDWRRGDVWWVKPNNVVSGMPNGEEPCNLNVNLALGAGWLHIEDMQGEMHTFPASAIIRVKWRERPDDGAGAQQGRGRGQA